MLNLIDAFTKSVTRHYLKEAKRGHTNQIAASYVERLTKGRKVPSVEVVSVFDRNLNQIRKVR